MLRRVISVAIVATITSLLASTVPAGDKHESSSKVPHHAKDVAKQVDDQILAELKKANVTVADRCNDEDFLRRTSQDLVGQLPTPQEVLAFRADSDADKRSKLIEKLIGSPEFGVNWARYWRDVIYMRATEQRSR